MKVSLATADLTVAYARLITAVMALTVIGHASVRIRAWPFVVLIDRLLLHRFRWRLPRSVLLVHQLDIAKRLRSFEGALLATWCATSVATAEIASVGTACSGL